MKKPAHTLRSRSFPIIIPAAEGRPAKKMDTITVQVWKDEDGHEFLTLESRELIERTRAKYMGLMHGAEIRQLRQRLSLSQDELSDLLRCGKKSLSRWENGQGFPSGLVNTILRALAGGHLTPAILRSLQEPRFDWSSKIIHCDFKRPTMTYPLSGRICTNELMLEPLAM